MIGQDTITQNKISKTPKLGQEISFEVTPSCDHPLDTVQLSRLLTKNETTEPTIKNQFLCSKIADFSSEAIL